MAPFCYRCPFNRARPERADARLGRKCHWECAGLLERKFSRAKEKGQPVRGLRLRAADPGRGRHGSAAGRLAAPRGGDRPRPRRASVADEVMTGFGRTGPMFACQKESVAPDLMALAKGHDRRLPADGARPWPPRRSSTRSWATTPSSRHFSTATATPPTNSARPPRWPASAFCNRPPPSAPAVNCKKTWPNPAIPLAVCPP